MTAREDILQAARRVSARNAEGTFTVDEVVQDLAARGSHYADSTIRTHVTSRMCANAPDNHAVVFHDFVRVDRGIYRLA